MWLSFSKVEQRDLYKFFVGIISNNSMDIIDIKPDKRLSLQMPGVLR